MPPEAPPADEHSVTFEGSQSSLVLLQYAKREMTVYALNESEVRSISFMNVLAMAFFSLASACATFAIGIRVEAMFQESLTAEAAVLNVMAPPICTVGALVFGGLGIWALLHRGSMLKTLREQSRVEKPSGNRKRSMGRPSISHGSVRRVSRTRSDTN